MPGIYIHARIHTAEVPVIYVVVDREGVNSR